MTRCGGQAVMLKRITALMAGQFEDPDIRDGLKAYSNWPTFPQLYVKGELIGGCDIVVEMYHSGELKQLLVGTDPQ